MRFYDVNPACIFAYFFCRLLTTIETYFNDSKFRNSEPETFDGSIKLQIVIFIVDGFLYVAVITGLVAIYLYKRETYKKGKKKKWYLEKRKERDNHLNRILGKSHPFVIEDQGRNL